MSEPVVCGYSESRLVRCSATPHAGAAGRETLRVCAYRHTILDCGSSSGHRRPAYIGPACNLSYAYVVKLKRVPMDRSH